MNKNLVRIISKIECNVYFIFSDSSFPKIRSWPFIGLFYAYFNFSNPSQFYGDMAAVHIIYYFPYY